MASIKTRELNKGSIKTIDRASLMIQHIKQSNVRLKDQTIQEKHDTSSPDNYAQERISEYGRMATERAGLTAYEMSVKTVKKVRQKKELLEVRYRKNALLRNRSNSSNLHSPKIKTSSEAQKLNATRKKAMLDKIKRDAATKNTVRMKNAAKKAQKEAKNLAKAAVRSLKAIIEGAKALFLAIGAAGSVAIIIILICVLFGAAFYSFGDESSSNYTPVSPEVEAYSPVIQTYANEYGIPEYTELIKEVMMQESGGKGNDPMQCSECGLNTKYPRKPNGIKNPTYSIEVGVHYLANLLKAAKCESPLDLDHIRLALQSYNYGSGYLDWAVKRDGGYTVENAAAFSDQQAKKHGWDSYGDKLYVSHVLRYYPYGSYNIGIGNTAITQVAAKQIGNAGGRKFWSWYGFNGRVEWCACFVSWCGNQCGYTKAGIMPKFSYVPSGVSWFKSKGQWQKRTYTPAPGDIIFFDWGGNGSQDHVGIVEKVEGGYVCTIEGNSGDAVRRQKYRIGYYEILGYGVPKY